MSQKLDSIMSTGDRKNPARQFHDAPPSHLQSASSVNKKDSQNLTHSSAYDDYTQNSITIDQDKDYDQADSNKNTRFKTSQNEI